jgi:hypothetical protein
MPCRSDRAALRDDQRAHASFSVLRTFSILAEREALVVTQCRILCSIGSSEGRGPFQWATT